MRLSKNFSLAEFLRSQTAARHGIDMTPPEDVVENIQRLVTTGLQPLRDIVGAGIYISSGYRPLELNTRIGGSKTSAHIRGAAADFSVTGMDSFDVCVLIVEHELPFDQIINEFGQWSHWGLADILRTEQLTAYRKNGKTAYLPGIIQTEGLL